MYNLCVTSLHSHITLLNCNHYKFTLISHIPCYTYANTYYHSFFALFFAFLNLYILSMFHTYSCIIYHFLLHTCYISLFHIRIITYSILYTYAYYHLSYSIFIYSPFIFSHIPHSIYFQVIFIYSHIHYHSSFHIHIYVLTALYILHTHTICICIHSVN